MDHIVFVRAFLKNWRETGSLVPSSSFLARKMIKPVDFSKAQIIVELGAGTGIITKMILKKMRKDARLLVFEINENFCERLVAFKDNRLEIIRDSAVEMQKYLDTDKAHYVISGLPLANFSHDLKRRLLTSIYNNLEVGGKYTQFQYWPRSYGAVKDIFGYIGLSFSLINLPPAFVYECSKK